MSESPTPTLVVRLRKAITMIAHGGGKFITIPLDEAEQIVHSCIQATGSCCGGEARAVNAVSGALKVCGKDRDIDFALDALDRIRGAVTQKSHAPAAPSEEVEEDWQQLEADLTAIAMGHPAAESLATGCLQLVAALRGASPVREERERALEEAIRAVGGEVLLDGTGYPEDDAYNVALSHAVAAIRALSERAPESAPPRYTEAEIREVIAECWRDD